ncbi:MAG: helix-turn-helix transcriptional regulator [Polyangiaceae bacterium]
MTETLAAPNASASVGVLLQYWRKVRHLSQLALAGQADISARHLCFVETGRAKPSREMVLLLAATLDVPLRERNALLLAAGFAPRFRETELAAPRLHAVKAAFEAIMQQQEPYPAVLMNRHWDVVGSNGAATRFFSHLLGPAAANQPGNVLRMMFDPQLLRPLVANWAEVAETLLRRVQREAVAGVRDELSERLVAELLAYPDVPRRLQSPDPTAAPLPIVPLRFEKGARTFNYFSTVTTLGTAQDVTLQELRIECFFPGTTTPSATHESSAKRVG